MADVEDSHAQPYATDLDVPDVSLRGVGGGAPVPPAQRVYFYSPVEWEEFILEWATTLGNAYAQVKRLGGSGDRGVDVAGFLSIDGFEGIWDCFQGKHYASALTPSDVLPEIIKLITHVTNGAYTLPRKYFFLAPQGCGPTLNRLLSSPDELKSMVAAALADDSVHVRTITPETLQPARELADRIDYSMFVGMQLHELLAAHSESAYHAFRFGTSLPEREPVPPPPSDIAAEERRYAEQLRDVYLEQSPEDDIHPEQLSEHPSHGGHFKRQRYAFYSAEALRVYARDSVPPGTFESLLDDMHAGVIETADAPHSTGRARLTAVLTQSTQVQLDGHRLVTMAGPDDRKGLCHHLANDDRLIWVQPDE